MAERQALTPHIRLRMFVYARVVLSQKTNVGIQASETYHWREGIGPGEKRPTSLLAGRCWRSPVETNAFGTDEYTALCREIGSDPYICANVGTGTAEEAANWLEYCNYDGDTDFAAMRSMNGHKRPFDVKYWGIGNESYFWYDDPMDYARIIRHYSKLMKMVDPDIKIIAAGWRYRTDWNRTILEQAAEFIDYISIHMYYGVKSGPPLPVEDPEELLAEPLQVTDYADLAAGPLHAERSVDELYKLIREVTGDDRLRIALDEWTLWHEEAAEDNGGMQMCSLQDGIFAAGMIHMMNRRHDCVGMAVLSNLVNSTCAVVTRGGEICLSPVYDVIQLYSNHAYSTVIDSKVEVSGYNALGIDNVPYIDCLATANERQNRISLALINRHNTQDIECGIVIRGSRPGSDALVYEINGPEVSTINSFESPDRIRTKTRRFSGVSERFRYPCPAHSVSMLEISVNGRRVER